MPSKQVEDVYNAGGFDGGPLGRPSKPDDTRLRIKCAAVAFAQDYGPLPAAMRGEDAAQERMADILISKLRQVGLTVVRKSE